MQGGILHEKGKRFSLYCLSFLVGVAIASIIGIDQISTMIWVLFFGAFALSIICWHTRFLWVFLCMSLIFFGTIHYAYAFPAESIQFGEQTVVGMIAAEPDVRLDGVRYIIQPENIESRIYVKTPLYPRYEYGDVVRIDCELKKPEPIEEFRYDMYLARFGVFAICQRPRVTVLAHGQGNPIMTQILRLKNVVAEQINLLWHEPHASFMAGLLYGYRGGLGSLNELFNRTGVTHIVAISGYNITIISTIFLTICTHLFIPRRRAFFIIITAIILFVIFAGASASVVRAGIMGIIVLVAKQIGRRSSVANVLLLTAVIMTLHNPFILIWDAGFQLSFLSTVGLVYLTPSIEKYFFWVPVTLGLQESVVSTLAAIVATLPLVLYQFGRLSIVAPIVNVLILWAIPLIMAIGFFAVCAFLIFKPFGMLLSWVAWLGMEYIIVVVTWFADFSFAAVDISVSATAMVLLYMCLLYIMRRTKQNTI